MNTDFVHAGAGLTLATLMLATPVRAQMACAPHDQAARNLDARFQERPVAAGVAASGGLIEVFAAPGGSFTILVTRPDGISCLVAAGDGRTTTAPTATSDPGT